MVQAPTLSGLRPLADLAAVSLDLETTGLNVTHDRIIQVGVVSLNGATILNEPSLNRLVNPAQPISETASRITGISSDQLGDAPGLEDVFPELLALLENRVLIGHHIAFDRAILRNEAKRLGVPWTEPPSLDVGHLMGALDSSLPDLGFDAVALAMDVEVKDRHSAFGDAMAVAEMYNRLLPRLYDAGIRTFAEAQTFAARRTDLRQIEVNAGWISASDVTSPVVGSSSGHIDSAVFSRSASDVMSTPPRFIGPSATATEAAADMVENRVGALLVGNVDSPPIGIVTERDLLRLFAGGAPDQTVSQIMSQPVECVETTERLYRVLGRMDRLGIRHLAVTGVDDRAVGVVSQRDLLTHRARAESLIKDAVDSAETVHDLAIAQARLPTVARGLLNDGQDGLSIAGVIARELQATTARAAELALQDMTPPPAPWCLMVLGSGGRGESLLAADQDNALIYRGGESCDAWFAEFGAKIADNLDAVGIPYCDGGVMASNRQWRGTEDQWRERVEEWLGRANPEDLLSIDIFFDLRAVAGDFDLADELHVAAVDGAARTRPFLALMAASTSTLTPQFGMFGGLRVENGRIDLKRQALLPLVSFARAVALASGVRERGTPERLQAAQEHGRLGRADATALGELHRRVMTFVLAQQLDDLEQGRKPSSTVDYANLPSFEKDILKEGLHTLANIAEQAGSIVT
jgi:DNA polymerase III epsilon subunit family exonuclease